MEPPPGKEGLMDQQEQASPRKAYAEPTLEVREHMDEVIWGLPLSATTTGILGP